MYLIAPIFSFLILAMGPHAFAQSGVQPNVCSVTAPIKLSSRKGEDRKAQLKINFHTHKALPEIFITFDTPQTGNQHTLSWPPLELNKRNGNLIFDNEFHQQLVEFSQTEVLFIKTSEKVYQALPLGLKGTQSFFTLFLTQYGFHLENNKSFEKNYVSLKGSDLNIRTLAQHCFPERSKDFLEGVNRTNELAKSWKTSYGLFNFQTSDSGTQELIDYRPILQNPTADDVFKYQTLTETLANHFKKRALLFQALENVQNSQSYLESIEKVNTSLQTLRTSKARIEKLYGLDSEIQFSRERIDTYIMVLNGLNDRFQNSEALLNPVKSEYQSELAIFTDNMENLVDINTSIASTNNSLKNIRENNEYLQSLISTYMTPETENELKNINQNSDQGPPLSTQHIQSIERNTRLLDENRKHLKRTSHFLNTIVSQMTELTNDQTVLLQKFDELTDHKQNINKIIGEYNSTTQKRHQTEKDLGYISFTRLKTHFNQLAKDLPGPVSHDEAKAIVISKIKGLYSDFDQQLNILGYSSALLPHVLCPSASFKKSYQDHCLSIMQVTNNRDVTLFLDSIDSRTLTSLYKVVRPINALFSGNDKTQVLSKQILKESTHQEFSNLSLVWEEILFYRWAYFSLKQLEGLDVVSMDNLVESYIFQENQYQQHLKREEELVTQHASASVEHSITLQNYRAMEDKYYTRFYKVRQRVLNTISLDDLDIEGSGLNCLIYETYFVSCYEDIENQLKLYQTKTTENGNQLKDSILLLLYTSIYKQFDLEKKRIELLDQNAEQHFALLRLLDSYDFNDKEGYLDDLKVVVNKLQAAHDHWVNHLDKHQEQLSKEERFLTLSQAEGRSLFTRIDILTSELSPVRSALYDHCQQETQMTEALNLLNQETNQLFKTPLIIENNKVYQSDFCQFFY